MSIQVSICVCSFKRFIHSYVLHFVGITFSFIDVIMDKKKTFEYRKLKTFQFGEPVSDLEFFLTDTPPPHTQTNIMPSVDII